MYQSIVILTGAGISAESGIKTFRASDGLWEDHRVEDVATPEGYQRNPKLVQAFYNLRRQKLRHVEPNKAHQALADFEKNFQGNFLLITQNIDNLHERAGNINLIHMHGELCKVRCQDTNKIFEWHEDVSVATLCPCCGKKGNLRPHVVWFGEMPLAMGLIYQALEQCDLFVSIGTSGNVYPAAGFAMEAKNAGAHTVELNLESSLNSSIFDKQYHGLATEIVPYFFQSKI